MPQVNLILAFPSQLVLESTEKNITINSAHMKFFGTFNTVKINCLRVCRYSHQDAVLYFD